MESSSDAQIDKPEGSDRSARSIADHEREVLLTATAEAAQLLLKADDLTAALPEALGLLGEAANMDRLLLLIETTDGNGQAVHRVKAEWTAAGVASHQEMGLTDLKNNDFLQFIVKLRAGESYWLHVDEVVGPGREACLQLRVVTTTGYPIFIEGNYVGLLAFDDCRKWRPFNPRESETLRTVAALVGSVLHRHSLVDTIARERQAAADRRATELARANAALSRSVAAVSHSPSVDAALHAVFTEIIAAADASAAFLFEYREQSNSLATLLWSDEQGAGAGPCPHAPPILQTEFDADVTPAFRIYVELQEIMVAHLSDMPPEIRDMSWPGVLDWHIANGRQSACAVPILIGKRPLGILGFAWKEKFSFAVEQRELLFSLTHQIAMIMELKRLADWQRQTAIAHERELAAEQRAGDLAQANQALRRAIDRLAREPSLPAFLGFLLFEIAKGLDCDTAAFTTYDPDTDSFHAVGVYHDGVVTDPGPMPVSLRLPNARFIERLLNADGFALFDVDADADLFWPGAVDWLRQRGKKLSVSFPILVDGGLYGQISLAYPTKPAFSLGQRELVQALSTQAALAIELTRLAEEAKQSAVAREREISAQQRANQLAAANKAMWRGSELIASAENENAVLGAMLSQAVEATRASGAAVMRRTVSGGQRVSLAALSQNGVVVDVSSVADLPCVAEVERLSVSDPVGYFKGLFEGKVSFRQCDDAFASWAPEWAAYHASHGHRIVWDYPFRDQAEIGGWVSLAFNDDHSLDDTTLQMLATLTSHVSLALKMGRLSILAREAAVSEERNRLAGEIHDSLAQSFAGIAMQLETAEDAAQSGEASVALSSTRRARELARFGLAEARRSVLALRPVTALAGGVEAAMKSLAERSSIDGLLQCSFTATGARRTLVTDCNFQLFRIAQEAVSNAVRHGRPTKVEISVDFGEQAVTLRVSDDGVGIALNRPVDASGGLAAIRQRVDRLKGQMTIESSPGHGTVLTVWVNFSECEQ